MLLFSEVVRLVLMYRYTTFKDEKNLYFCMEFVEGGELFYRLRKDIKFQVDAIQFYMAEIVAAL